jgi:hypothetical protein
MTHLTEPDIVNKFDRKICVTALSLKDVLAPSKLWRQYYISNPKGTTKSTCIITSCHMLNPTIFNFKQNIKTRPEG